MTVNASNGRHHVVLAREMGVTAVARSTQKVRRVFYTNWPLTNLLGNQISQFARQL